jgi:hypothetical protein
LPVSHIVIPAQAGIQTGFTDVRRLRLDSRLRGNDVVKGRLPFGRAEDVEDEGPFGVLATEVQPQLIAAEQGP